MRSYRERCPQCHGAALIVRWNQDISDCPACGMAWRGVDLVKGRR